MTLGESALVGMVGVRRGDAVGIAMGVSGGDTGGYVSGAALGETLGGGETLGISVEISLVASGE